MTSPHAINILFHNSFISEKERRDQIVSWYKLSLPVSTYSQKSVYTRLLSLLLVWKKSKRFLLGMPKVQGDDWCKKPYELWNLRRDRAYVLGRNHPYTLQYCVQKLVKLCRSLISFVVTTCCADSRPFEKKIEKIYIVRFIVLFHLVVVRKKEGGLEFID